MHWMFKGSPICTMLYLFSTIMVVKVCKAGTPKSPPPALPLPRSPRSSRFRRNPTLCYCFRRHQRHCSRLMRRPRQPRHTKSISTVLRGYHATWRNGEKRGGRRTTLQHHHHHQHHQHHHFPHLIGCLWRSICCLRRLPAWQISGGFGIVFCGHRRKWFGQRK